MNKRQMEKAMWAHLSGHLNGSSDEELAQSIGLDIDQMTDTQWQRLRDAAESVAQKIARH